jgi:uncharacterized protein (DUF58 family)
LGIGVALAGVGWGVHAVLLALAGTLFALTVLMLFVWQRQCLTGVTYHRTLRQERATFGEEVGMDIELINDKVMPLTWLHVEDSMPTGLTIRGGTVTFGRSDQRRDLHHLLPMLPFQRVRRRLTVICDQRGVHTFGPTQISSGDPIGLRQRFTSVKDQQRLLVYPKLFRLEGLPVTLRVPLGDVRSPLNHIGDPSRIAGVREYREGDPLRHVDWRATARGSSLLVREFEPTASWRVAVFLDMRASRSSIAGVSRDVLEFTIALGASVLAYLVEHGVETGLYASGSVQGRPVIRGPNNSPAALSAMLELLALASPYGPSSIAELLMMEGSRLRQGTSVIVVARDFDEQTLAAMSEVRRHRPVTALWVATDDGRPPPIELVDLTREVRFDDDWKHKDVMEFRL